MNDERKLTTAEAAERLNRSRRTIQLWAERDMIPGVERQEDGSYLIPESSLERIQIPKLGRRPRRPTETTA